MRSVRRRELMLLLSLMLIAPRPLRAQQKATPVIGILSVGSPDPFASRVTAFDQGLKETGWVEGQTVAIEYRWAGEQHDRLLALAADLVGRKVDVIAANGIAAALAARNATSTIPIVFHIGTNPVADGLVVSFARPGGNLTGVTLLNVELVGKKIELMSELVPRLGVIALLVNPNNPSAESTIGEFRRAAASKGMQTHIIKAGSEKDIDTTFVSLVHLPAGALVVSGDPFFTNRLEQLLALESRHAVPTIHTNRLASEAGGLTSYGPSLTGTWSQLGGYVGNILNGTKPADLPVEQPTRFELVINLKTANALGLNIPHSLLLRADEVIE